MSEQIFTHFLLCSDVPLLIVKFPARTILIRDFKDEVGTQIKCTIDFVQIEVPLTLNGLNIKLNLGSRFVSKSDSKDCSAYDIACATSPGQQFSILAPTFVINICLIK